MKKIGFVMSKKSLKILVQNRIRIRLSEVRTEDPDPYKNVTDPEHCWNMYGMKQKDEDIWLNNFFILERVKDEDIWLTISSFR